MASKLSTTPSYTNYIRQIMNVSNVEAARKQLNEYTFVVKLNKTEKKKKHKNVCKKYVKALLKTKFLHTISIK